MARNPNILKAQKQRRKGRRAWFNDYGGAIHVPRSVGKSFIPDDAQALFNYRDRAKGTFDPFLEAIFPTRHFPAPSDWKSEGADPKATYPDGQPIVTNAGERNGRRFALERADEERLVDRLAQDDLCDFVTLRDNKKLQCRLTYVFNRKKTKFFFIEAWYAEGASFIRISKEYKELDNKLFDFSCFNSKTIHWQEVLPLASLELLLPSRG